MPMWNLKKSKEKFGFNWVDFIKALPKNSAGRIRYEKFKNEPLIDDSLTFEENFLKLIAREYYQLIGEETKKQILEKEGKLPNALIACIGGGSNAIGLFHPFLDDKDVYVLASASKELHELALEKLKNK